MTDVPAAVVCAKCGRGDCLGCEAEAEGSIPAVTVVLAAMAAVALFAR